MKWLLGLCFGFALALVGATGLGSSSGIGGYSGKDGVNCNTCHNGGTPPIVALVGPTALDAGATAVYTFTLTTGMAFSGIGAAASDGTLAPGTNTKVEQNEVQHSAVVATADGGAIYTFSLTAPEFGGAVTIFAAGNATDGNGNNGTSGDRASTTTLVVNVSGPQRPVDAGPDAEQDATVLDASKDATTDGPWPITTRPDSGGAGEPPSVTEDGGGCSVGRSSLPAAWLATLLAGAALASRRRRRS
jgi:hypothetical protein